MLENAVENLKTFAQGKKLAVAVSGGADSTCLLHLILSCDFLDKSNIFVVNIEHGIRAQNSLSDSQFVERFCQKNEVKFIGIKADIPELCKASGRSAETEAREFRRKVFRELIDSKDADLVATAHHINDNAETILMHALRGCGLKGLVGMDVVSLDKIFRPLLNETKGDILKYNALNGVEYVTDETNADSKYNRNFIRLEVMPILEKRYNACSALAKLAKRARQDEEFIERQMDLDLITLSGGVCKIDLKALCEPALAVRYAIAAFKKLGLSSDYDNNSIDCILALKDMKNGSKLNISCALTAVKEYDSVTLYKAERKEDKIAVAYDFEEGIFEFKDNTLKVTGCKPEISKGQLILDADKLPQNCIIRYRQDGDRFRPFGGGEKKLKEYLIDIKIPARLRDGIPLVCYGHKVLCVAGLQISDDVKLTLNTVNAFKIELF